MFHFLRSRLNYYLSGGLHPLGFHATNILLHTIISVLSLHVFAILFTGHRMVDGQSGQSSFSSSLLFDGAPRASLLGALLFATHPIHTESVSTYLRQSLSAEFRNEEPFVGGACNNRLTISCLTNYFWSQPFYWGKPFIHQNSKIKLQGSYRIDPLRPLMVLCKYTRDKKTKLICGLFKIKGHTLYIGLEYIKKNSDVDGNVLVIVWMVVQASLVSEIFNKNLLTFFIFIFLRLLVWLEERTSCVLCFSSFPLFCTQLPFTKVNN